MGSVWGNRLKISIFGESHGPAIGVVLDGLPHGIPLDFEAIAFQMERRAPGNHPHATERKESDLPQIQSGVHAGRTTGAPLCALIANTNTRSADYNDIADLPRPSHADWTAHLRYAGCNDVRGGGHFSGRLTAPIVFAGSMARQALKQMGISVGGRITQIGSVLDSPLSEPITQEALLSLAKKSLAVFSSSAEQKMAESIENARSEGDSLGGIVEVIAHNVPAGWGSPMFDTVEGRLAQLLFGIPAVKGVEFGSGFALAHMRGSEANDAFLPTQPITTATNHSGGINGGITNGMPIVFRAAIKPTASIAKQQKTFRISTGEAAELQVSGRHDPCIVPRALPVLEAATAIVLLDLALEMEGTQWIRKK